MENTETTTNSTISEYEQQAIDFLAKTKSTIEFKFLGLKKHFDDDKHERFCWEVTIIRGNRSMVINFGDSLNKVEKWLNSSVLLKSDHVHYPAKTLWEEDQIEMRTRILKHALVPDKFSAKVIGRAKPTNYDILACLTKYDPGTLENFCSEFGYEQDSRKAEKTYVAVKNEYKDICSLYTDEEIELLAEIN